MYCFRGESLLTSALVCLMVVGSTTRWLVAQSPQLVGQSVAGVTGDSSTDPLLTESLLAEAKLAERQLSQELQTVIARGRVRNTVYSGDLASPRVTLDADVQVYYDAPKFLLWMQHGSDAPIDQSTSLVRKSPTEQELAAQLSAQQVLFDGKTLTTVRRYGDGSCRGDIYFDFHRPQQLRSAGFPFENLIELWRDPLAIDRADLLHAQTTPLSKGGFMGELSKDTYRLKFYFLGGSAYDLRRVSFYGNGQDIPFRDWHLSWKQTEGVHYVERLVRRINTLAPNNEPLGTSSIVREQSELEYSHFELPDSIDAEVFDLSGLELPEATAFHDHRVNVGGKPKLLWWRQGQLSEQP